MNSSIITQDLVAQAKAIVIDEQNPSVSLLQRRLHIGFGRAEGLMAALEAFDVVTPQYDGLRRLSSHYETPKTARRAAYVRKVFETSRFFWEMWEEGSLGDTRAIEFHKPAKLSNTSVRDLVLGDFYKKRGLSLYEAAAELAKWLELKDTVPSFVAAVEADLAILCANAARPFQAVVDVETVIQRSFVRVVRYLQQTRLAREGAHSRCFEYYLAAEHVPTGYGKNGGEHPEHVVPCAFLRDRCIARLAQGASVEEVAQEIRPFLAIVMITEAECANLDNGPTCGGLGLKDTMPANWDFETGDIFARLHVAGITFDPPPTTPAAACAV
ncbi:MULTISPECIES: DNA translocase FtsK [unclassified Cupriavidus]|uniref:DNA translocase FtsK n=1 Tax=unclassified Cupriavidus TaxID=2640874 RepID=UPI00313E7504